MKIEIKTPIIWDFGKPKELRRERKGGDYGQEPYERIICIYSSKEKALDVVVRLYAQVYPQKSAQEFRKEFTRPFHNRQVQIALGGIAAVNLDYLTASISQDSQDTVCFLPRKDLEYRLLD